MTTDRYHNQDHAMLTGMLAVRNVVLGERNDLWSVNTNSEYKEELHTDEQYCLNDFAEALSPVDVTRRSISGAGADTGDKGGWL